MHFLSADATSRNHACWTATACATAALYAPTPTTPSFPVSTAATLTAVASSWHLPQHMRVRKQLWL